MSDWIFSPHEICPITNATTKIYLIEEELALASTVVQLKTVLDVFDLILSKVNLK